MKLENYSTYQLVADFNRSELRRNMIPHNLFAGWPCIHKVGKMLCITIPYFSRSASAETVALYPIYCSVTLPIANPDRLLDFTIYPHQRTWSDLDYSQPVGYFKHAALGDVNTKQEYTALCMELYGYFDQMVEAVAQRKPFENEEKMIALFTKLMEPGQYPQYLRINKKFYSHFCRL